MRKDTYEYPQSSMLGMPKDAALIMSRILESQDILKLLVYTTKDWKSKPPVTSEMVKRMFETEQISSIPRLKIDKEYKTYLRLIYGTTVRNTTNPYYRDNDFGIDILCHYDCWDLGDFDLRPYRLAGEIDARLDGTHLTGIGELEFIQCAPYVYDQEFAGVTLSYMAIRGHEDEVNPLV